MRRVALLMLFAGAAAAKPFGMQAGRSGAPTPPAPSPISDVPGPAGSASMTVNFGQLAAGSDGVILYYGTSSSDSDDPDGYPYRKFSAGAGLTSVTVTGLAAGTYYCRPAGYVGTTVGDLSQQIIKAAA